MIEILVAAVALSHKTVFKVEIATRRNHVVTDGKPVVRFRSLDVCEATIEKLVVAFVVLLSQRYVMVPPLLLAPSDKLEIDNDVIPLHAVIDPPIVPAVTLLTVT